MFELVGAVRNLCTILAQIEKDLQTLIKQGKPEEKTNGGTKK